MPYSPLHFWALSNFHHFGLYITLFGKKIISRIIISHVYVCRQPYTLYVYMFCFIYSEYTERYTNIHLYTHTYKCTFMFSETETNQNPRENYLSPQLLPQLLETSQYLLLPHQNCQIKRTLWNEGRYRNGFTSFRVRENETSSWDQHIYWVCYVSKVTKVKDLRNTLCGSFHTL